MSVKKLAIAGKVIDISKIGDKSQAQFAAQLKQNGIVLSEERLTDVYKPLHDGALFAARLEQMSEEERAAYIESQKKGE